MPKRLPIARAREIGDKHSDVSQIIIVAYDGERVHMVSWGRTIEDCDQAALAADALKRDYGWPERLQNVEPSRIRALKRRIAELEAQLDG